MNAATRLLGLTFFYLLYICIGAGVFMALEHPYEQQLAEQISDRRNDFLARHSECISPEQLDDFVEGVEKAWQFGVSYAVGVNSTANTMWDFGASFFFTTTLLTTIGYGHVSPLTWNGQLFCLFFALFGIPFTFFFLGTVTYIVSKPSQMFLDYLTHRLDQRTSVTCIRVSHLLVLFVLILVFFFLIPAALFSMLEDGWNVFESFYFIVISLTTIGLGDFVPGTDTGKGSVYESTRSIYFICVSLYLLFGLGMMLLLVDTVIKIPEIQRLWEMSSMNTPASSASTSLSSSRSSSPTPMSKDMIRRGLIGGGGSGKMKPDEERELTRSAAPIGRMYDSMTDKENGL